MKLNLFLFLFQIFSVLMNFPFICNRVIASIYVAHLLDNFIHVFILEFQIFMVAVSENSLLFLKLLHFIPLELTF